MATITSTATGDWGTGGTWVGGVVPANNDTVVIAAGHVVTFNVDQSGFADGIAGITVTGTLTISTTTSSYMKIKAATTIAGAGTLNVGTSASPIPFAVKHTITGGAAWFIQGSGGLTMTVYAAEPATKTILLSGNEALGQTELSVDTNITSDIWADGDSVRIDNINKAKDTELRVIAAGGRAAAALTVTVGLTAAKITGALVNLVTRNVRFVGNTGNIATGFTSAAKLVIAGGEWVNTSATCISGYCTISGGTFTGSAYGVNFGSLPSIVSGGIFSGNTRAVSTGVGATVSGGTFSGNTIGLDDLRFSIISGGLVTGNTSTGAQVGTTITGGTFSGNTNGIGGAFTVKNATFSNNTVDVAVSQFTAYNTLFGSTTEYSAYTSCAKEVYSESIDHDQTAGAFRAWTKGGTTASNAVTVPVGYTTSYIITLADASNEGFWQKEVTVGAGASVNITMNLYKSGAMAYLPRCIIFNKAATDPFAGGAGINTFTMTDSTTTWEDELYTYTNSTANDVTLVIRFQGKNASGTVATALLVEQINVDLTSVLANLAIVDGIVDAIKLKTDNLPSDPADQSLLLTAIQSVDTDILGATVEGVYTVKDVFKLMASVMAGKVSGGGTTAITFRDLSDALDRVTATVDSDGNRSAITLDLT